MFLNDYNFPFRAATNGHLDVIRILSAYGADVGTLNIVFDSPMHCAAMKGYAAICKFLGQRGKLIFCMIWKIIIALNF